MKKSQEINEKIIDILLKKAEGIKYFEEQYEYANEKRNKNEKPKYENFSFFENYDRGDGFFENYDDKIKTANEENKFKNSSYLRYHYRRCSWFRFRH